MSEHKIYLTTLQQNQPNLRKRARLHSNYEEESEIDEYDDDEEDEVESKLPRAPTSQAPSMEIHRKLIAFESKLAQLDQIASSVKVLADTKAATSQSQTQTMPPLLTQLIKGKKLLYKI